MNNTKIIEYLSERKQNLIHEDSNNPNILTFIGSIESFILLNPLPAKFQRQLDEKRIQDIMEHQKKLFIKKNRVETFNPIYLTYVDNKFEIIDGQHRYFSFKKLFESKEIPIFNIEYKIIICQTIDESYSYFDLINLSKPLILPKNRTEAEEIRKLFDHIKNKYKKNIKTSDNPRCPNINLEHLRQNITNLGLIQKCIETEQNVISCLEELNDFYKDIYYKNNSKWRKWGLSQTSEEEHKFFLGFYKNYEWICHLIKYLDENIEFKDFEHNSCIKTEKVTKKLRKDLWKKYFNQSREGKCYVCEENIEEDNFQAGHIISRARGGNLSLSNLKPVCSSCNQNMKIENMEDYKLRLIRQLE